MVSLTPRGACWGRWIAANLMLCSLGSQLKNTILSLSWSCGVYWQPNKSHVTMCSVRSRQILQVCIPEFKHSQTQGMLAEPVSHATVLPAFQSEGWEVWVSGQSSSRYVQAIASPSVLSFVFPQGKASLWRSPSSQTHHKLPLITEPSKSQWMDPENLEVSGPPRG